MQLGDLVVHIGAKPSGYRLRLVCDIESSTYCIQTREKRKLVVFADGRKDWQDSWMVFDGWKL